MIWPMLFTQCHHRKRRYSFGFARSALRNLSLRFDGHYVAVVPEPVLGKDNNAPAIPVGRFEIDSAKLQGVSH